MTTFPFFPNLPNAPDYPGDDQPGMQTNTSSTNGIIGVDHIGFNVVNGGFHNIIHVVPQASDPALSSVGQVYTKTVTDPGGSPEDQLFYESTLGNINRLTGGFTLQNGYQYVGKIIIQWGITGASTGDISVTFSNPNNITFPNNIFIAVATPMRNPGTYTTNFSTNTWATTGFKISNTNSSSTSLAYSWIAIGN